MEKIELYNKISREIVKNYNMYLHVEDVVPLETLDAPEHFTISHIINKDLANKLHETALQLKGIDESLTLNKPENYHITLFWKGLDSKLDNKHKEIREILDNYSFEFKVEELLFGPKGISAKFYPMSEDFVNARMKLYKLAGVPININELFVTTWVSLATYTQTPSNKVKEFIQINSSIEYGTYKVNEFTLYISNNKQLDKPKFVESFSCS